MSETFTTEQQGTATRRTRMRVLAVTSYRPEEIVKSVSEMDAPAEVISIEPSTGRVGHVVDTYRQIRTAIREYSPDVILLDCFETIGAIVTLLTQRQEIPVVARLVGDTWTGFGKRSIREAETLTELRRAGVHQLCYQIDRRIFERADGFIAVSRELTEIAAERTGCPQDRIGVVPVPITTDTLESGSSDPARDALGIEEKQVILTVTNLKFEEKYRGVTRSLEEIAPLLRTNDDLGYVIAGGGRYEAALRDHVEQTFDTAVRDQIYLPGWVDAPSDLYAAADIFVYVSYRDGYPNVVLEAQTAQLPVVANAAHGMREQITHGETGLLFDSEDEGALRNYVTTLLTNPGLQQKLGVAARKRVFQENTPEQVSERLELALREILTSLDQDV